MAPAAKGQRGVIPYGLIAFQKIASDQVGREDILMAGEERQENIRDAFRVSNASGIRGGTETPFPGAGAMLPVSLRRAGMPSRTCKN